jgi:hypothetical protein
VDGHGRLGRVPDNIVGRFVGRPDSAKPYNRKGLRLVCRVCRLFRDIRGSCPHQNSPSCCTEEVLFFIKPDISDIWPLSPFSPSPIDVGSLVGCPTFLSVSLLRPGYLVDAASGRRPPGPRSLA